MKIAPLLLALLAGGIGVWLYSQYEDRPTPAARSEVAAPTAELHLAQTTPFSASPQRMQSVVSAALPQALPSATPFQAMHHATPGPPMPTADKPADLTTLSQKRYKQARVWRVEPDGITYIFAGGMVKIPFTDLPEEIRKANGYDVKRAVAFATQEAASTTQQSGTDEAYAPVTVYPSARQRGKETLSAVIIDYKLPYRLAEAEAKRAALLMEMPHSTSPGGKIEINLASLHPDDASPKWFAFIVLDSTGKEILRQDGDEIPPRRAKIGPGDIDHKFDGWVGYEPIYLPKWEDEITLHVVDRLQSTAYDFRFVRAQ